MTETPTPDDLARWAVLADGHKFASRAIESVLLGLELPLLAGRGPGGRLGKSQDESPGRPLTGFECERFAAAIADGLAADGMCVIESALVDLLTKMVGQRNRLARKVDDEQAAERNRLLALVAAQAEQNAEAEARCDEMGAAVAWSDLSDERVAHIAEAMRLSRFEDLWQDAEERADKAEAELAVLHATDEYQRWARAVAERDAARDAVAAMRGVVDAVLAQALIRRSLPDTRRAIENVRDEIRAALEGGAVT